MPLPTHAYYAWIVTALVVICATVIVVTGHTVPEALWVIAGTTGGGAAGLSVPAATARTTRAVKD